MSRRPPLSPDAGPSRRRALQALAGSAVLPAALGPARAGSASAGPALRRGFNLAHWFEYERTQPLTGPELAGLRRMGLDHVRIPLDPVTCGWQLGAPDKLPFMADLTRAVGLANDAGLTAVIDLHLLPEQKLAIEADPALEAVVAGLWARLARQFAGHERQAVVYELFNEPQYYGALGLRWVQFQRQLLAAVRHQDDQHMVLLCGARGGNMDGLLGLWPEADAHVAYTFHFYEPFLFTHQAIAWLDARYTSAGARTGVRYPASDARKLPPTPVKPHPMAAQEWADYLAQDWGERAVRERIDRMAVWARARHVRVLCTEFGAIRANTDPVSRYRWLGDVRKALEANDMGWTVWDYTHIFGITAQSAQTGMAGRRTLDGPAYAALGLVAGADH